MAMIKRRWMALKKIAPRIEENGTRRAMRRSDDVLKPSWVCPKISAALIRVLGIRERECLY